MARVAAKSSVVTLIIALAVLLGSCMMVPSQVEERALRLDWPSCEKYWAIVQGRVFVPCERGAEGHVLSVDSSGNVTAAVAEATPTVLFESGDGVRLELTGGSGKQDTIHLYYRGNEIRDIKGKRFTLSPGGRFVVIIPDDRESGLVMGHTSSFAAGRGGYRLHENELRGIRKIIIDEEGRCVVVTPARVLFFQTNGAGQWGPAHVRMASGVRASIENEAGPIGPDFSVAGKIGVISGTPDGDGGMNIFEAWWTGDSMEGVPMYARCPSRYKDFLCVVNGGFIAAREDGRLCLVLLR